MSANEQTDPDREDEKDGFDGTEGMLRMDSVDNNQCIIAPDFPGKERGQSNRPDGYNTMSVAGVPLFHPSDLSKVPGRIIEMKSVQVRNFRTCLVEERFKMVYYTEPGQKPK